LNESESRKVSKDPVHRGNMRHPSFLPAEMLVCVQAGFLGRQLHRGEVEAARLANQELESTFQSHLFRERRTSIWLKGFKNRDTL
jgi:hypothetical protein